MKTFAFGWRKQFLGEKRTEAYYWYVEGASQKKIAASAKSSRGAAGSAGWQAREVQGF